MLNAEQIKTSVNPYSGQVEFSVNLVNLPGRNGLDLDVSVYYRSDVQQVAQTWNLDAPTGVLGLGWDLPFPRIVAQLHSSGAQSDVGYFLIFGSQSSRLIPSGADPVLGQMYERENYAFWKIYYDAARERWKVIRDDGNVYIYGDSSSARRTVQWGAGWDNWLGSSNRVDGQDAIAVAWNLNQITDRFGNTITYSYENVDQPVASASGLPYTQASYLAGIVGVGGEQVLFHYLEKDPKEYQDPHINPAPPNAYQDRFSTRYLDSIQVLSAGSVTLYTERFNFAPFLGTDSLSKRLLSSIVRTHFNGQTLPGPKYAYWGQDPRDGVSAVNIYNAPNHALYGAIKSVTLPEGGVASYQYEPVSAGFSARNIAITPRSAIYSKPRFQFKKAFALATWYGSDQTIDVQAYFWDGRWLAKDLGIIPAGDAASYETTPIAAADNLFAIYSGNQLHVFFRNQAQAGEWIQPPAPGFYSPAFTPSEAVTLVAGERFVAIAGLTSGKLYRYRWNGIAWQEDPLVTLTPSGPGSVYALTAKHNWLLAMTTAGNTPGAPWQIFLFFQDQAGAWQSAQFQVDRQAAGATTLALYPGDGFVAFLGLRAAGSLQQAEYGVVWWNALFSTLQSAGFGLYSIPANATANIPVVRGSLVAIGQQMHRFDGVQWNFFDLATVTYPNEQQVNSVSVGVDVAVRLIATTSPQPFTCDLLQYDPNTGAWSNPASVSQSFNSAVLANAAARTGEFPSNYAVFANHVYYRRNTGAWTDSFAIPETLSALDVATVQLLASGYLIYQVNTGQPGVQAVVRFLRNGTVAPPAATLAGQQIFVGGMPATALVGSHAFVTYTGTFDTPASTLTLCRSVNLAVQDKQIVYAVLSLTVDNGYGQVPDTNGSVVTGFQFEPSTASVSSSGAGQFNKSSVFPGSLPASSANGRNETYFFNGLSPAETPSLPYPASPATAQTFYSFAKGLSYAGQAFAQGAASPVAASTNYWTITTRQIGQIGLGAYARQVKTAEILDGVPNTGEVTYSTDTGLPVERLLYNVNAAGQTEQFVETLKYWWEIYDPTRSLNLLSPVIQCTNTTRNVTTSTNTVTAILINTWKENWGSGSGHWAPCETYRALNGNPGTFTNWFQDTVPPAGWLRTRTVFSRTPGGLVRESDDVEGRRTSIAYDRTGMLQVSAAENGSASGDECAYFGLEPYENTQGWGWSDPSSGIWQNVTTSDFHTGTQCLLLPPKPALEAGPIQVFQPAGQSRLYVFSCWAKVYLPFTSTEAKPQFRIAAFQSSNNAPVGNPILIDLTVHPGFWNYIQYVIDLDAIRRSVTPPATAPLYLAIQAFNQNATKTCAVDELRFSPLDAVFSALVYDPVDRQGTAAIDTNGQAVRTIYDGIRRPISTAGPSERVNGVTALAYSRQLIAGDSFQPLYPNSVLTLATSSFSRFDDFHDEQSADWTFNPANGSWKIESGKLSFTGTSPTGPVGATATLNVVAHTNFAARVKVGRNSTPPASVAMGNGDVYLQWLEGTGWRLVRVNSSNGLDVLAVSNVTAFQEDWIFVVVDGFVMAYAGGIQLFCLAYNYPNPVPANYGKLTLALTASGFFDDLLILDEPQLSVAFLDGLGTEMQRIALEGKQLSGTFANQFPAINSGVLFDNLGRPQYDRNSLSAPMTIAPPSTGDLTPQLLKGGQSTYLYDSAGTALTIPAYLSGAAGGFDFSALSYELSPLSRILTVAQPRDQGTAASLRTITLSYGGASSLSDSAIAAPGDPLSYSLQTRTWIQSVDKNNVPLTLSSTTVKDQAGKILTLQDGPSGGPFVKTAYIYDAFENVVELRPPNYFDPPSGSDNTAWVQTMRYTFDGLLSQQVTPDSGTSLFLYDKAGRLRFVLDAQDAAHAIQLVQYRKYDNLSRILEIGFIQDSHFPWSALNAQVDNNAFPVTDPSQSQDPNFAQGAWTRQAIYDTDGNPLTQNLLGRLWKARMNNGSMTNPDEEWYTYDTFGNSISKSTTVKGYDAQAVNTMVFGYDGQNNLSKLTYPQLDPAVDPLKVGYYYDRLGRLAAVGDTIEGTEIIDPDKPPTPPEMRHALYSFDFFGRLSQAQLNNDPDPNKHVTISRQFTYNTPNWLTQIQDNYFTETLDYFTTGGIDGVKYFDGEIAAASFAYQSGSRWQCPPVGFNYKFQYDAQSRLTAAANSLQDAWSIRAGIGTASGYDANGNTLTLSRGVSQDTNSYLPPAGTKPVNNRLLNVASAVNVSMNFEGIPVTQTCANGWCWGSNNGGLSATGIFTGDAHSGTQCLKLAGGSLGHFDFLTLLNYLAPNVQYTLTCWVKTDTGFAQAIGDAAWVAEIYTASGQIVESKLAVVAPATAWTQMTVSFNLPQLLQGLGLGRQVNRIALTLRNAKRVASPSPGPFLLVDDIQLQGSATSGNLQYDADGAVVASPSKGISTFTYDPVLRLATGLQMAGGDALAYAYGSNLRTLETFTPSGSSAAASKVLLVNSVDGRPLAMQSDVAGQKSTAYFIYGLEGLLAVRQGSSSRYVLQDHLGSTRIVVEGDSAGVAAAADYLPSGAPMRTIGDPGVPFLYTGQEFDNTSGLYNYVARLYDPDRQRFYSVDPSGQYGSPYAYANNNPVNLRDPNGNIPVLPVLAVLAVTYLQLFHITQSFFCQEGFDESRFGMYWNRFSTDYYKEWQDVPILGIIHKLYKNFSRHELCAIRALHHALSPVTTPLIIATLYRDTETYVKHITNGQEQNAKRHCFWQCYGYSLWGESVAISTAEAHELARPGERDDGDISFDDVSDKINNPIGRFLGRTSNLSCIAACNKAWTDGHLAENGNIPAEEKAKCVSNILEIITPSWIKSMEYLYARSKELPEFNPAEQNYVFGKVGSLLSPPLRAALGPKPISPPNQNLKAGKSTAIALPSKRPPW